MNLKWTFSLLLFEHKYLGYYLSLDLTCSICVLEVLLDGRMSQASY